jgi:hypothetical protein
LTDSPASRAVPRGFDFGFLAAAIGRADLPAGGESLDLGVARAHLGSDALRTRRLAFLGHLGILAMRGRRFAPLQGDDMQRIALLTGERASVYWGNDLAGDNRRFLESLDPDYYWFAARQGAGALSAEPPLERADQFRAATGLRIAYGQGVETLMAVLCALAQAPQFPLGWMLRYRNEELRAVVGAIDRGEAIPHLLVAEWVSWESLSAMVHSHIPEVAVRLRLVDKFARFWGRTAHELLSDSHQDEYNALKHGLRVMPGGFSVAFGVEKVPGQRAAPEDMRSLGGSAFGSSFNVPLRIEGAEKHHLRLSHRLRNWSWEALAIDLQLISQSINNVVGCLRVIAGAPPGTVRFEWPDEQEDDIFARYQRFLATVEHFSTADNVEAADIERLSPDEVRCLYDDARQRPPGAKATE